MARLLVHAKGARKGEIVRAFPDNHQFGRMEDYDEYVAHFGSDEGWRGTYVIIDVPDMPLAEAEDIAAPVVDSEIKYDAEQDEEYSDDKIRHRSKGLVDLENLEVVISEEAREALLNRRKVNVEKKVADDVTQRRT